MLSLSPSPKPQFVLLLCLNSLLAIFLLPTASHHLPSPIIFPIPITSLSSSLLSSPLFHHLPLLISLLPSLPSHFFSPHHSPLSSPPPSHHLPSPNLSLPHHPFSHHPSPPSPFQTKNLRKQVLQFFKEYESLTDEVCVDRFFSLIAKFMSYDVEEFKRCAVEVRALGCWQKPVSCY